MHLIATPPPTDDLLTEMRAFVIDQGNGRTDETQRRYVQVADDLEQFLAQVDVEPWLGPEIARYLDARRGRHGSGALIPALGLLSVIRVLPAFVSDPWLPPPGAQRKTHRTAVRHLVRLLRRKANERSCLQRADFRAIDKALGHAYSQDYASPTRYSSTKVTCTVTMGLENHLVDRLFDEVEHGTHPSFDEAVAARLNPVQVTVWRDPEPRDPWGW